MYACSFLVHVVQAVLQWGKDPIEVANRKRRKNESVANMQKMTNFFIVNISMRKMILEVEYSKSMIYEIPYLFD